MSALLELFLEFFRISLFVIGGGYSILVVADRRFARLGWTKDGEIIDQLPVFQSVPGLIATHTAVYVGRKRAGALGAFVAVIAVAVPAIAIFIGVTVGYRMIPLGNPWLESAFVGLRAALTGIIAATIVQSWRKSLPDAFAYALMIVSVLAIGYFHVPVALVLVLAMLFGLLSLVSSTSTSHFNSLSLLPLLLFAQYGSLCFGGGFVLVPMYIHDFVGASAPYLQIAESEFGDIMALSQTTPGPIAVNCATFFGYRLFGVVGAIVASAMLLLPGSVLVYAALSSLERFRTSRIVCGIMRGIRPASIALMLVALFAFAKMTVFHGSVLHPWGAFLIIIVTLLTMSRKVNIILLIILCAFAGSALRAEITVKEYPDADTVIIDNREDIEYFPDGTFKSVEECWTKALTEKGRRELGTDTLHYSQRYGAAKFLEVSIISPDGTKRVLPLDGLVKESTDNSSTSANIYDPLDRIIVCNIPGLKVGDTVYVKKERSTFAARCQNQWAEMSVFEAFSPIIRSSLRVKCPAERPIRSVAIRNPLGNIVGSAVTNADGSVTMEWCATNSPQAFYEPSMPSPYKQLQHLYISTARDWQEMSRWYWELCAPHLAKTNAAMVAKVDELKLKCEVEGRVDRDELMRSVFKFVSQEVRYMGLTMEDKSPGYAPHDVDITFDKRYGVCRDKAGLLAAMLRLAGFEAYPVLIMAGSAKMDPEVPSPYFNHAIVAVSRKDLADSTVQPLTSGLQPYLLLDPTAESTKDLLPSYESDCSYLVARPDGEKLLTTPMPSADDNLLKISSEARLDESGSMIVVSEMLFNGLNDTIFRQRFLQMKPIERVQFFVNIVAGTYPSAQLLSCAIEPEDLQDISRPLTVNLSILVPDALLRGNTETRLQTGMYSKALGIANMLLAGRTALEKRRFPLRISSTAGIEETLTVASGDTLGRVTTLPETVELTGSYEYGLSAVVTDGVYSLSRKLKVNSLEFSPDEYLDLRERIKAVEAAERRYCAFAANPLNNADIRYRLRATSVDFTGERSWVMTNKVVKEVLTYDGKKANSEFELNYNPLIKRIKIVNASVTGPDGKTVSVSDKEQTELDCGWAASAPRYPASRKLIVTLPSVEIGSIITTIVESVTTEAPAEFRSRYYLDSVEPTDVLVYRIGKEVHRVSDPARIPIEEHQPPAYRWRKSFVVDRSDFASTCAFLRRAADVEKLDPSILQLQLDSSTAPQVLRDWMAKHVRVRGPSLYEVPLERQLTDPATVVKERYATRLDYIRTMAALLKGAGLKAEVVFASSLRGEDERYPLAYSQAVCRVDGLFLGLENEYTPLEATAMDGCWYLDPKTQKEDVIRARGEEMRQRSEEMTTILVCPNGAVDMDIEYRSWGAPVGSFRKRYEEMLPELRSRFHQSLLGGIAQSATATSELVTDTKSYPARTTFSCYIPDYAVVEGDNLSLSVGLSEGFAFSSDVRRSPMNINRAVPEVKRWKVVFPEGYTEIENLPEPIVIHDPRDAAKIWSKTEVKSEQVKGHLEVTVVKTTFAHEELALLPDYFPLLRDWLCRGSSARYHTITARRK